MACATLLHSQPSKRRIDSVDGAEAGSASKCKRSSNLDFGLSSASFGSPPRSSPPLRDGGRLSPKYFARPAGSSSPSLNFSSLSLSSTTTAPSTSTSAIKISGGPPPATTTPANKSDSVGTSKTPEPRVTIQQIFQLCKQELRHLDTRLRQEYEQALTDKLSEQYQSFIQFAQDELQVSMQGIPPDSDMSYIG